MVEDVEFSKKLPKLSSRGAVPFCILPAMNREFCCSTSLSTFGIVSVLYFSHSDRWVMISHDNFNLQFLMTYDGEHVFICLFAICLSSLVRCLEILLTDSFCLIDILTE